MQVNVLVSDSLVLDHQGNSADVLCMHKVFAKRLGDVGQAYLVHH